MLDAIAELIPISSPLPFTRAPPLFPGFTAASVCRNDSIGLRPFEGSFYIILILRAFALMIPAVTVEVRLNGFPTAKTHSPTFTLSELP